MIGKHPLHIQCYAECLYKYKYCRNAPNRFLFRLHVLLTAEYKHNSCMHWTYIRPLRHVTFYLLWLLSNTFKGTCFFPITCVYTKYLLYWTQPTPHMIGMNEDISLFYSNIHNIIQLWTTTISAKNLYITCNNFLIKIWKQFW